MFRRRVAIVFFAATAVVAANPTLIRFPFSDRARLAQSLDAVTDPRGYYPEYRLFLRDVRDATKSGDTIAIVVPFKSWDEGYAHPFLRASYLLAGRQIIPIIPPARVAVEGPLPRPQYAAVWGVEGDRVAGDVVFERHRGRLMRLR